MLHLTGRGELAKFRESNMFCLQPTPAVQLRSPSMRSYSSAAYSAQSPTSLQSPVARGPAIASSRFPPDGVSEQILPEVSSARSNTAQPRAGNGQLATELSPKLSPKAQPNWLQSLLPENSQADLPAARQWNRFF